MARAEEDSRIRRQHRAADLVCSFGGRRDDDRDEGGHHGLTARCSRRLLASSSLAALLIGGGALQAIAAPCAINVTSGSSVGSESTAGNINCIRIQNATVTGSVTNTNPFTIAPTPASPNVGIFIIGGSIGGAIVNAGTITAGSRNVAIDLFNASVVGGVRNSGSISGRSDIFFSTSVFSGGITNSGSMSATGTAISANATTIAGGITNSGTIAAQNIGIYVAADSTFANGITNSGTIAAQQSGVAVVSGSTFSGGINNSGTIFSAAGSGINVRSSVGVFSSGISNSGTITAQSAGILVGSSTFSGGIANRGIISAARTGIAAYGGITFANGITNTGTISALGTRGIFAGNVSQFSGDIVNAGMISAAAGNGIELQLTTFAGDITNSSGATIAAHVGIKIDGVTQFGGDIVNGGTIRANGTAGIVVGNVSLFAGAIINTGKITATNTGIAVGAVATFAGGIKNSGTIVSLASRRAGISFDGSGRFGGGISNGGLITAAGTGIAATFAAFAGGIANSGTIFAGKSGINLLGFSNATFAGGISNSGTISLLAGGHGGITVGIVTKFTEGIGNSGSIAAVASGIRVASVQSFAGGITNSSGGTISAATGMAVTGAPAFGGGIVNDGTIRSTKAGIFVTASTSFSGNIGNTGTIAAKTGIRIGVGVTFAAGSALMNSGTITGSAAAIDVHLATSPVTIEQTAGAINGAIQLSTNADVLNVSGGTINGNIIGAGSRDTVNFAPGAGNSLTYANNFTGINQVNINSGTVILNGSNTATHFDVNGGTLAGTGTLDPLTVTIHSGATLAPGTPGIAGGTLKVVGTLAFQSGAVYAVTINGASTSSTRVTGTAVLGGAQLSLANGSTVAAGQKYTILTDTGGGLGGSNTFTGTLSYGRLRGVLSYDADDVYLTFQSPTLSALLPASVPVNITNTAAAIDNFINRGGTLPSVVQNLSSSPTAQLQNGLAQLSGEVATGGERSAVQLTGEFLDVMVDPFVRGRGGNMAGGPALGFAPEERAELPDGVARAYASIADKPPPASFDQRWRAWGSAYGGSSRRSGDPVVIGSHDISASAVGFAGGMDYRLTPSMLAGFALAGGGTGWGLADGLGSGRSDAWQVGGYGVAWFGPTYVAGALSFANHSFTTNRSVLGDQLTASFMGQSYGGRVEGGYRLGGLPRFGVTPYGAVQVQTFRRPAYQENDLTGGGLGLAYAAMRATDVRTELGARFDAPTLLYGKPLILYGRVAWTHDFHANPALSAAFETLPGASFTVYGAAVPRDAALAAGGAQLLLSANWSVAGTFRSDLASGSQSYGGNGTLRYTW